MERIKFNKVDFKKRSEINPAGIGSWIKAKSLVVAADDIEYCYCEEGETIFIHYNLIIRCKGDRTKDLIKS